MTLFMPLMESLESASRYRQVLVDLLHSTAMAPFAAELAPRTPIAAVIAEFDSVLTILPSYRDEMVARASKSTKPLELALNATIQR